MINIETYKKSLGDAGKFLPDEEVKKMMELQYKLANAFFDLLVLKDEKKVVATLRVVVHKKDGNVVYLSSFIFFHSYVYAK